MRIDNDVAGERDVRVLFRSIAAENHYRNSITGHEPKETPSLHDAHPSKKRRPLSFVAAQLSVGICGPPF